MAILNAGAINPVTVAGSNADSFKLFSGNSVCGIVPTTAISKFANMETAVAMMILTKEAGTTAFHFFGKNTINKITNKPIATAVIFG